MAQLFQKFDLSVRPLGNGRVGKGVHHLLDGDMLLGYLVICGTEAPFVSLQKSEAKIALDSISRIGVVYTTQARTHPNRPVAHLRI